MGQPGRTQWVTLPHPVALLDRRRGQEGDGALETPTVVDAHGQHPRYLPGKADHPGIGRPHRSSGGDREVHAPMTGVAPFGGERCDDRTFHRRSEADAGDHPELSEETHDGGNISRHPDKKKGVVSEATMVAGLLERRT